MLKSICFPISLVVALWGAGALLFFELSQEYTPSPSVGADQSVIGRLLGSTKSAFSQRLFDEADRYFHRGVGKRRTQRATTLYARWADILSPDKHEELQGDRLIEIMPWLEFATQVDSRNVEAYLVAAFWLRRGGKVDSAHHVLKIAQKNNPENYQVYQAMGINLMHMGNYEEAMGVLEKGRSLWPGKADPEDEQSKLDLAQMLAFQGALYEVHGLVDEAIELHESALVLFPDKKLLVRRIEHLKQGDRSDSWTFEMFEHTFRRTDKGHMAGGGH